MDTPAPAPPVLVRPDGQPLKAASRDCPRCGAGPDRRVPSAGFGEPVPVCAKCGWAFTGERWDA